MSTKKEEHFEKSLSRLEEIVASMESGDLDLEQMITYFEEGSKLVKSCGKKLTIVEQKIEMLVKEGEELKIETFDAGDDE